MSTWPLFGRAFMAARKEIPPKQWIIRIMLGILTGITNQITSAAQALPWRSICIGIGVCLVVWLAEILWSMVTRLPLKLQAEVEELRQTQLNQQDELRMEIMIRLRCEYQMDHPNAPETGIPKDWI